MRTRDSVRLLVAVALAAAVLQACTLDDLFYGFDEDFEAIAVGTIVYVQGVNLGNAGLVVVGAQMIVDGSYGGEYVTNAAAPTASAAAAVTLPPVLRFIVQRRSPSGLVHEFRNVDVTLQSDGVIPEQTFEVPFTTIGGGDQIAVLLQPLGADLPAGTLRMRVRYRKS